MNRGSDKDIALETSKSTVLGGFQERGRWEPLI